MRKMLFLKFGLIFFTLLNPPVSASNSKQPSVPCGRCFPTEDLEPSLRSQANLLLLTALDSEALYTLVGQLKPLSQIAASSIKGEENIKFLRQFTTKTGPHNEGVGLEGLEKLFGDEKKDPLFLEKTRNAMASLRCGNEFYADVAPISYQPAPGLLIPFWQGEKEEQPLAGMQGMELRWLHSSPYFFNLPAMSRVIKNYQGLFNFFGITPNSHPMQIIGLVPNSFSHDLVNPKTNRAMGLLYGYPEAAVNFFVESEMRDRKDKKLEAEREFISIPTFMNEATSLFAVAKGNTLDADNKAFVEKASNIFHAYKKLRQRYIIDNRPDNVTQLIRNWFDDGNGQCSSENAKF